MQQSNMNYPTSEEEVLAKQIEAMALLSPLLVSPHHNLGVTNTGNLSGLKLPLE